MFDQHTRIAGKPIITLIAAAASLSLTSPARGVMVWFDATASAGPAGVFTNGQPGSNTSLFCNSGGAAVSCSWNIQVDFATSAKEPNLASYDVQLYAGSRDLSPSHAAYSAGNPPYWQHDFSTPRLNGVSFADPYMVWGNGWSFFPIAPGTYGAYSFTLTLNAAPGILDTRKVLASIGRYAWTYYFTEVSNVQFGSNPVQPGIPPYLTYPPPVPVIDISVTPEPLALGFMGIGAVALLRRRRGSR